MPKPMSFGGEPGEPSKLPSREVVEPRQGILSPSKRVLRLGKVELPLEYNLLRAETKFTFWTATLDKSAKGTSVHVNLTSPNYTRAFYVLLNFYRDPTLSHPELGSITSVINGIKLDLVGVGSASEREAWKDSDAARNVIGFIDIHRIDDPELEPMLVWLTYTLGKLSFLPTAD